MAIRGCGNIELSIAPRYARSLAGPLAALAFLLADSTIIGPVEIGRGAEFGEQKKIRRKSHGRCYKLLAITIAEILAYIDPVILKREISRSAKWERRGKVSDRDYGTPLQYEVVRQGQVLRGQSERDTDEASESAKRSRNENHRHRKRGDPFL